MSKFSASLITALRNARSVVVFTGAGVSAESGIPTFRDVQSGLWAKYRPEDIATPNAFRKDPKLVWEWYAMRRKSVEQAKPNAGHLALVEIEDHVEDFTLITQNVDGLHRRAGSRNIIELHGNIMRSKCFDDGIEVIERDEKGELPPRCPRCGGMVRPDVVWFGEMLPEKSMQDALKVSSTCNVFLSIGTSAIVYPAAGLPLEALHHGARVVEINRETTAMSSQVHDFLKGPAGEILPELIHEVWN